MKLVILTNILTPYRKSFFDELYKQLSARGDEFTVLVMARTEPDRNWNYEDYKAEYTELLDYKTKVVAGLYIHSNSNLKIRLKELQPDVLIAAGSYTSPSVWKAIKYKKKLGYRLLFWSESHLNESRSYGGLKLWLREKVRKSTYKGFDGFLYPGKNAKAFIEEYAKANATYYQLPNLIDNRFFDEGFQKYRGAYCESSNGRKADDIKANLREELHLSKDKQVWLCPARLSIVKGQKEFAEILSKIETCVLAKCQFVFAGDGELRQELEELYTERGIDAVFTGFIGLDEMIKYYGAADIFLLPSLSDPNPLTCIEALWSGLPLLVSTHVGNAPEVIEDGKNGFVFSYDDIDDAVEKVKKIINLSNGWYAEAIAVSRDIAINSFCLEKVVKGLSENLESVMQ